MFLLFCFLNFRWVVYSFLQYIYSSTLYVLLWFACAAYWCNTWLTDWVTVWLWLTKHYRAQHLIIALQYRASKVLSDSVTSLTVRLSESISVASTSTAYLSWLWPARPPHQRVNQPPARTACRVLLIDSLNSSWVSSTLHCDDDAAAAALRRLDTTNITCIIIKVSK